MAAGQVAEHAAPKQAKGQPNDDIQRELKDERGEHIFIRRGSKVEAKQDPVAGKREDIAEGARDQGEGGDPVGLAQPLPRLGHNHRDEDSGRGAGEDEPEQEADQPVVDAEEAVGQASHREGLDDDGEDRGGEDVGEEGQEAGVVQLEAGQGEDAVEAGHPHHHRHGGVEILANVAVGAVN